MRLTEALDYLTTKTGDEDRKMRYTHIEIPEDGVKLRAIVRKRLKLKQESMLF